MAGILVGDYVEVREQSEGSRLYGKGNYGYPRSGGGVDLDLVEAVFLVETSRLKVNRPDGTPVEYPELFRHAAKMLTGFDTKYMVYRDLRGRGLIVKFESGNFDISVFPGGKNMSNSRPEFMVRAVSERDAVDIAKLIAEARELSIKNKKLMYGVVDEEGDVTYYTLHLRDPAGKVYPEPMAVKPTGRLIRDRTFVFDRDESEALRDYGFYGKSMSEGLQLSLLETIHLVGKGRITAINQDDEQATFDEIVDMGETIQNEFRIRYLVYTDLRERGLVVKTGFKYGAHFRAYQSSPDDVHARFLVHAVTEDGLKMWPEVSRTVRLSGGVKKEILFGLVRKNQIDYIEFKWFRPGVTPK